MDTEQRAIAARQLMDNPLLNEILGGVREAAIAAWLSTSTDGQKQREYSWLTVKVIDRIQGALQGAVDDHAISMSNMARAPQ